MTTNLDSPTQSGSRETLYTMALNHEERQVKYAKKTPAKINQDDLDIIERFYEQINRDQRPLGFTFCCDKDMFPCFNGEKKGWYCGRCFKWIRKEG